jgi:hypothetical protein
MTCRHRTRRRRFAVFTPLCPAGGASTDPTEAPRSLKLGPPTRGRPRLPRTWGDQGRQSRPGPGHCRSTRDHMPYLIRSVPRGVRRRTRTAHPTGPETRLINVLPIRPIHDLAHSLCWITMATAPSPSETGPHTRPARHLSRIACWSSPSGATFPGRRTSSAQATSGFSATSKPGSTSTTTYWQRCSKGNETENGAGAITPAPLGVSAQTVSVQELM